MRSPITNEYLHRRAPLKLKKTVSGRENQAGYSLLMVVFLVATILVLSMAVTPNILTQGRREREAETVWRGEQYERAIGMYYRKFGKYPTKIEDLTKQTNGVRFLRQAYKDPMNKDDGSWRFIYVGPNGQLIGSVRQGSVLQSLMTAPGTAGGTPTSTGNALGIAQGGASGTGTQSGFQLGPGVSGTANSSSSGTGIGQSGQPGQAGSGTTAGLAADSLQSQPQPLEGTLLGGNIIGVASKIKTPSFRLYQGGDTYQQWEFIWNPNPQITIPGQNSANPAVPPPPGGQVPGAAAGAVPGTAGLVPGATDQNPQVPVVNPAGPTQ